MTFSEPLVDVVLDAIRQVPAGTFLAGGRADTLDEERARKMSMEERLWALNALMLRAEALRVRR